VTPLDLAFEGAVKMKREIVRNLFAIKRRTQQHRRAVSPGSSRAYGNARSRRFINLPVAVRGNASRTM
jgi:hypothetical protein